MRISIVLVRPQRGLLLATGYVVKADGRLHLLGVGYGRAAHVGKANVHRLFRGDNSLLVHEDGVMRLVDALFELLSLLQDCLATAISYL